MQDQNRSYVQKASALELNELLTPGTRGATFTRPLSNPPPVFANEYAELKRLIKQKGLLDQQPAYYTYKILFTMGLLVVSAVFLLVVNNFWLQLLNAAYMAFVFGQIAFLGHDLGHRQVFRTT